ncbi:MAG: hypothetical protein DWH87_01265 [Planctomycetota bacterium]|nr:MAG: hypothetical protein DWH87_01265 [Planctomycetota bacterium]
MFARFPFTLRRFSLPRSARSGKSRFGRRSLRKRPGHWEILGVGMHGTEMLEQRMMLAADLVLSFNDADAWYAPATQTSYALTVSNIGSDTAQNAVLTTALGSQISGAVWSAAYQNGGVGPLSGAGGPSGTLTLPAGASVTFSVIAQVAADETGALVTAASVSGGGDTTPANNAATSTLKFVPASIAVTDDIGWSSTSKVRLVVPATGAEIASATAFEAGFKGGVRTALGDLDGDGKHEVVAVSGHGRAAEVLVFKQQIDDAGKVTLVKDPAYTIQPFGASYRRGLQVAVGDFDGNGTADIAVAKAFGKGDVKVYTSTLSATQPLTLYRSFTPTIAGSVAGVRLAAGDFGTFASGATTDATKADNRQELVIASTSGVKPTVQVVDLSGTTEKVVKTVSPFTAAFKGGLHVVAARFNADAVADLVIAQDGGGTSKIQVYDGKVGGAATPLSEFAAYGDLASKPIGVTVAAIDTDGDGRIDQMIANQNRVAVGTKRVFDYDATQNVWAKSAENTGVSRSPLVAAPVAPLPYEGMVTTASGLVYRDLVVGSGASPSSSTARVTVNYTGWLLDGTRFDGNSGVSFNLNQVIAGWTEGLSTMQVGSRRILVIAASLGYGAAGSPPSIPGGATLVFDVELLSTT